MTYLHGHNQRYNLGCRCAECKAAHSDFCAHRRIITAAWRKARGAKPRPVAKHGTATMYTNHACRCDLCKAAKRLSKQKARSDAGKRRVARKVAYGRLGTGDGSGVVQRGSHTVGGCAVVLGA